MSPPTTTAGRPRNPDVNARLMTAALEEYSRTGWSSFTMQRVARRAGVGKSALYLRWSTKEQLLLDSIESATLTLTTDIDTGGLRTDLRSSAARLLRYFLDPIGMTTLRIAIDVAVDVANLDPFQERIVKRMQASIFVIFTRALDRGEIAATTPLLPLAESLFGAVCMHALTLPPNARKTVMEDVDSHVDALVDVVFRAATGPKQHGPPLSS